MESIVTLGLAGAMEVVSRCCTFNSEGSVGAAPHPKRHQMPRRRTRHWQAFASLDPASNGRKSIRWVRREAWRTGNSK
jgi:hypothetical protein